MPYTVTKETPEGTQSVTQVMREVVDELKGVTKGQVMGVVGDVKTEELQEKQIARTAKQETERKMLIEFLRAVIIPAKITGKKSLKDVDEMSLSLKLDAMSLWELKRFIPAGVRVEKITPQELPVAIRAEINRLYRDISP